jgi:Spy/CpxP family protein refolding chaperone
MKQIIFILSMLLLTAQTAVAQGDGGGRVRNIRKEYVKGKLHLTEAQGQKFWPIYSQYLEERSTLRKRFKNQFIHQENGKLSDYDAYRKVDNNIEYKELDLNLSKKYKEAFLSVLSPQQLADLYQAEREFKQMLIERMKDGVW